VHYLYTGAYETLKPQGVRGLPNSTTEYRRGILVYCIARLYGLDGLADHAMRNIGLFDKGLSIFEIFDIAREVYPKLLGDEIWFPDYLKTKIETAFEADETMFAQERFLNYIGKDTAFTKALVEIMVGIYREKMATKKCDRCKVRGRVFENPAYHEASVAEETPDISILKGLTVKRDGMILNMDGVAIGELIEGDAKAIAKKKISCNDEGQFKDKKKNILGKAKVLPQIIKAPDPQEEAEAPEELEASKTDEAESTEPPPLCILDTLCIENDGTILSVPGKEVIGKVIEGDAMKSASMMYFCDTEGNVVNYQGKPIGKVETVAPAGAAATKGKSKKKSKDEPAEETKEVKPKDEPAAKEEPPTAAEPPPLSILKDRMIELDGTILNDDGDVIGEVTEGVAERFYSISAKCDGEGNVIGSKRKKVGKVKTVVSSSQPAADEFTGDDDAVREEIPPPSLPEEVEEAEPKPITLEDLDGRMIEANGDILDDDSKVIGKLVKGKADKLHQVMATCDEEGAVWHGLKKVGKVEVVQPAEKKEEESTPPPPPVGEEPPKPEAPSLAVLDGRKIDKFGEIYNDDNVFIGKLVEGSASKLSKAGATCDAKGNVWAKGKKVKDAKVELALVLPEEPEVSESPAPEPELWVADPDVEQSSVCPFRVQHLLNGDSWKNCNKCRAMIRQVSIQLAQEEGSLDKEGIDTILLR
jgi:hypothetical protein